MFFAKRFYKLSRRCVTDIHIELEEKIADFMGMEKAVLYSYGFSTVTSAIQAYVKSKDIVFVYVQLSRKTIRADGRFTIVDFFSFPFINNEIETFFRDEKVNFAIQKGLQSSKAKLVYFKHNSPEDLERLILENRKKASNPQPSLHLSGDVTAAALRLGYRENYKHHRERTNHTDGDDENIYIFFFSISKSSQSYSAYSYVSNM